MKITMVTITETMGKEMETIMVTTIRRMEMEWQQSGKW